MDTLNKCIGHEQKCRSCLTPPHMTLQSHVNAVETLLRSRSFPAGGIPPGRVTPEGRSLGREAVKAFERLVLGVPRQRSCLT